MSSLVRVLIQHQQSFCQPDVSYHSQPLSLIITKTFKCHALYNYGIFNG